MTDPDKQARSAKKRAAWLAQIEEEVLKGLPNEQERRNECLRNLQYYNLEGARLVPRRPSESDADYSVRPKRALPFSRRVVNVLCSKLYAPGPTRRIEDDDAATKWIEQVYNDCLMNAMWQRADRMSTLNGMAAFQVGATGDPERPISVQVWSGWHEVIPYEMPERANVPEAVVTIDSVDNRTRYTLWCAEWYRVYETEKLRQGQTSGGRVARQIDGGDNPYGVLPFAFVWFELPVSGCDSVHGIGCFLSDLSESIDSEMSDMAEAVRKYHTPVPVAYNCDVGLQPVVKMGNWIRVNQVADSFESQHPPRLEYLQAALDIGGGWTNIRNTIDSELEAIGIPLTAYRMDSATLPSGAALVAEQKPLIEYATERREPFRRYESDLKAVCCTVGGNYYGQPDLVAAAGAPLSLTWPPASIDLPGAERDATDDDSVAKGYESPVMIVQRRFGLNREQAIAHMKQVADDHLELAEINAELRAREQAEKVEEAQAMAEATGPAVPEPSANGNGKPVEETAGA